MVGGYVQMLDDTAVTVLTMVESRSHIVSHSQRRKLQLLSGYASLRSHVRRAQYRIRLLDFAKPEEKNVI